MFHNRIKHNNAYLSVHKSTFPNIDSPKVLVSDTWDYVDLWLKRNKKIKARFFLETSSCILQCLSYATKRIGAINILLLFFECYKSTIRIKE